MKKLSANQLQTLDRKELSKVQGGQTDYGNAFAEYLKIMAALKKAEEEQEKAMVEYLAEIARAAGAAGAGLVKQ